MHVDTVRMFRRWRLKVSYIARKRTHACMHTDLLLLLGSRCCFSVRRCLFHLSCIIVKGYKQTTCC
jgi:hypothetical protein